MTFFKNILTLLFLFITSPVLSQDGAFFFDKNFNNSDKDDAAYYRLMFYHDSVNIIVHDFHITGEKLAVGFTTKIPPIWHYDKQGRYLKFHKNENIEISSMYSKNQLVGPYKEYFETGQLFCVKRYKGSPNETPEVISIFDQKGNQLVKDGNGESEEFNKEELGYERGKYVNGLREGTWTGTLLNGDKWFTEDYSKGVLVKGIYFDPPGNNIKYKEIIKNAEFKGGIEKMYAFIENMISYPIDARSGNRQGTVFVRFTVKTDGSLDKVSLLKGVYHSIDAEALRIVKAMSGRFNPALHRGKPVNQWFTMPISFLLD
ncbi:MAG: TonB family protein [Cytophagales bacterium]|nr:TonB family protein [Cytophagales bacterium]